MRGSSYTIGVEIPQVRNEFQIMIVEGVTNALAGTPYRPIIAPLRAASEGDEALQSLADRQVDGIIAVVPLVSSEWLDDLALRIPVVMVGRHDVSPRYDTVAGADESGTNQLMTHLIELGHRRIAMLQLDRLDAAVAEKPFMGATGRDPHSIRSRVYQDHMGIIGLSPQLILTGVEEEDAAAAVRAALEGPNLPTAIFASNDTLAIGALRAVAEAGMDAQDVSVVGYDDISIASHPLISLTSVDQDGYAVGREAVRLLLERITGRTGSMQVEMPVTLQVRGSTAQPRRT